MTKLIEDRLVVASHNQGKINEINDLVAPYGLEVSSAKDHQLPEPVEDGTTFEQNAYIKAFAAASATGLVALSDDSGLCVDALEGAPGIHTADWAEREDGSGRDFLMAMEKVEAALQAKGAVKPDQRKARFVAVLCLCQPDGQAEYFRGEVEGRLIWPPRGDKGFGYDPVFLPDEHKRTFGEMTADEKHSWQAGTGDSGLSHRARAFAAFANIVLENPALKSAVVKPEKRKKRP